jgi:hypothetical protein
MNIYAVLLAKKGYELKVFVAAEDEQIAAAGATRWHRCPVVSVTSLPKKGVPCTTNIAA